MSQGAALARDVTLTCYPSDMTPQRFAELQRKLHDVMADITREAAPPKALALVDGVLSRMRWASVAGETEAPSDAAANKGEIRLSVALVIARK